MIISSYNFSIRLKEELANIELLRRQILLIPLSPKTELRLKWESKLQRVFWSLSLTNNPVSKAEMIKLISNSDVKKVSPDQREVLNYAKALDYITHEWLVSTNQINFNTFDELFSIYSKGLKVDASAPFSSTKKDINVLTEYLQAGSEHPIIQAGISQINLLRLSSQVERRGCLSCLIPYLFLYKYGYNFRDMLVIDEYFRRDIVTLKQIVGGVEATGNLTIWLEYFTKGISIQLAKVLNNLKNVRFQTELPSSFWKLNSRQKEIVGLLEQPDLVITNNNVQKMFGVSQITASRDLTKLTELGLLLSHGKGRSTYYTRV
jgi:DNA-binding transcriptional ArsR family regulator